MSATINFAAITKRLDNETIPDKRKKKGNLANKKGKSEKK